MLSLITGVGARGQVGEAVALALGRRGDTVVVVARAAADAQERARDLVAAGWAAAGYGCDLSNPADVDALQRRVAEKHGDRLDALVNLAGGFGSLGPIATSDPTAFDHQLRINLVTGYLATRAFFPALQRARGSVVFFASEAALEGSPTRGVAAYVAAKAAVVALMRSVADEGREYGVRANALAPAAIRTATNEAFMGNDARYVERDDVASVVSFLCSASATAITGQVIRLRK
ncbi:MAG TPA: SDR family oxidoreductase [Gemmatimonadaceae bacterium]|nr:SDR family oxidoreductase [Gemmatimonadaceae bacterium]